MTQPAAPAGAHAGVPRLWRLGLVVVIAAAAFALALHSFRAPPQRACLATATNDPAYRVRVIEPPSLSSNSYHVAVTHSGQPVTAAQVCMAVGKVGMSGLANTVAAQEESAGSYSVMIRFPRPGAWSAKIGIVEPGRSPVVIPLELTVGS